MCCLLDPFSIKFTVSCFLFDVSAFVAVCSPNKHSGDCCVLFSMSPKEVFEDDVGVGFKPVKQLHNLVETEDSSAFVKHLAVKLRQGSLFS